jgi:hypothetical protein
MPQRGVAEATKPVIDPANWRGEELAARQDWILRPTEAQIDDLRAMARDICGRLDGNPNGLLKMSRGHFDFGRAKPLIDSAYDMLRDGLGLVLIRGLPVDSLSRLEAATIYWAIGVHIGSATSNNPQGDMLGHVINLGKDQDDPKHRGYQTKATMDYHCDQCDVVGLLCLQTSKSGGLSKVASSVAVYNELLARRPEIVDALEQPFFWTMHGEIDAGQKDHYVSPVFNFVDGYLCTSFGPKHIEKGHLQSDVPDMSQAQAEAIQVMERTCEDLHYAMELQKGDIQFLNNSVALHTRTGFDDWPEQERRRHLWRLWLNIPDIRPPSPFIAHWRQGRGIEIPENQKRIVLDGLDGLDE